VIDAELRLLGHFRVVAVIYMALPHSPHRSIPPSRCWIAGRKYRCLFCRSRSCTVSKSSCETIAGTFTPIHSDLSFGMYVLRFFLEALPDERVTVVTVLYYLVPVYVWRWRIVLRCVPSHNVLPSRVVTPCALPLPHSSLWEISRNIITSYGPLLPLAIGPP
jgi:hypothetical protein